MRSVSAIAVALALALVSGCSEQTEQTQKTPAAGSPVTSTGGKTGEELFRERCASCHPDGGNTINPRKTLHRGILAAHGIKDSADIVDVIRKPGPGMVSFDDDILSDAEAQLIADYVLTEFR